MPDTVPSQDKIVFFRKLPLADIDMVKQYMGMALPGQLDHSFGNVNTFPLEPVPDQRIDEAAAAPAAYIEGKAASAARGQ